MPRAGKASNGTAGACRLRADLTILAKLSCILARARAMPLAALVAADPREAGRSNRRVPAPGRVWAAHPRLGEHRRGT
jgi:hypothetical protein